MQSNKEQDIQGPPAVSVQNGPPRPMRHDISALNIHADRLAEAQKIVGSHSLQVAHACIESNNMRITLLASMSNLLFLQTHAQVWAKTDI